MVQLLCKISMQNCQNIKQELPIDAVISLLGIYLKELKSGSQTDDHHPNVNYSTIHNRQNVDTTYMSINE